MRKTTYYLIAFLISSCLWQINAQTTHNLDWYMGISSADASLTIDAGDTVIWTFTDSAPHSVASDESSNESFDSGTLDAGSTYQYTFTEEGVNDYHCGVHPSMVGTITVNAVTGGSQVFVEEDFSEGELPDGWTNNDIVDSGEVWQFDNPGDRTIEDPMSDPIAIFDSDNYGNNGTAENAALETPVFDASTATAVELRFDHYFYNLSFTDGQGFVEAYNGTDWVEVISYSSTTDNPSSEVIDITDQVAGVSNAQVRFRWTGNWAYYWLIDNIYVGTPSTCFPPTSLEVSNITATTAEISWVQAEDETEWEIIYGEPEFDPQTEGMSISDNNGTIGEILIELSPETEYEVYVKSICDVDDESEFSDSISFTTPPSCPAPNNIIVSNVTPTSAEVSWTAGGSETEWELLYGETGFDMETEGMTANDNNGELGIELTDLTAQMQYDVYVKAVCGVDDESTWIGPYTFGDYNALEVTAGFNEDVIANGIGDPSTTTTSLVDNDSFAYMSEDYQFSESDDPVGYGLPINGNLSEGPIEGLNFQLADYSANNVLRMDTAGDTNGGTLTFDNTQTANNLYIMATSGSGSSVLAGTITFNDDTTQDIPNTDVPDWYGGPADMTIISGIGRVNVTNGDTESNSSNPRIYQLEVSIDPSNYGKTISSIDLYKESGDGVINVFGASIQFAPDCPAPTEVMISDITADSAEITWTAGNTETEWEILYGESEINVEAEGMTVSDDDGSLGEVLESLSPNTEYEVYVKAVCGVDDESLWVGPIFFTTPCLPYGDFVEDFDSINEGEIPNCWSKLLTNSTSSYAVVEAEESSSANSDPNHLRLYNSGDGAAEFYLITPQLENLVDADHQLRFYYDGTSSVTLEVGTMSDPNDENTFTTVETLTTSGDYEEYTVVFDESYTDPYIAFKTTFSSTYYSVYLDDVNWEPIPSCLAPTDVDFTNITTDSAEVTWTAGDAETEWEVLYGEEGFNTETEGISITDDDGELGVTLSELSMDTTYEVYVRAICDDNSSSIWEGPVSFSTIYCPVKFSDGVEPITLVDFVDINNVTSASTEENAHEYFLDMTTDIEQTYFYTITVEGNTAGTYTNYFTLFFDWNQDGEFNNEEERFEIGSIYDSTGEDGEQASTIITVPENALLGETRMRVIKRFNVSPSNACNTNGYGQAEDYTVNVLEASCANPTELMVENVTATNVDVSWVANGDETEWEILFGAPDFNVETEGELIQDTDELGETLPDLSPNTEYEVYVRAICGESSQSQWIGPEVFTTGCEVVTPDYLNDFTEEPTCWTEAGAGDPVNGPDPESLGGGLWFHEEFLNEDETTNMAMAINLYTTNREDWLISPSFDLSQAQYELKYVTAITEYDSSSPSDMGSDDEVQLLISQDNGETWETLLVYDQSNSPSATGDQETIDLSSYSGTVKFAFWATDGEVDDDEDYDFFVDNFEVTESLSVDNQNFVGFNYYPNPVKNSINLESRLNIEKVSIYNLLGQEVSSKDFNEMSPSIDMSNLASGSYILKVQIGNQSKIIRVIKE